MDATQMFWTIFGAIGTTTGTIVTAIAVIIAIFQYRQPIRKGIRIRFSQGFTFENIETKEDFYAISVSNTCMRKINITGIFLNIGNKDMVDIFDNMQLPYDKINFPILIEPEDNIEYRLLCARIDDGIRKCVDNKEFKPNAKVLIHVRDSSGKDYYYKKLRWRAKDF
jgi:hypothetical protein